MRMESWIQEDWWFLQYTQFQEAAKANLHLNKTQPLHGDGWGYKYKRSDQESWPNTRMRPKWAQQDTRPIGLDSVAQHRGHKNSDTPGQGSDIRSSTRILWVLARRLQSFVQRSLNYCHKLVLYCCPNSAHTNPLPCLSSPLFLSKTKVRMFPFYWYNGQEFKNELTWWLSLHARARVIGPSGGDGGVDVSFVLMSTSSSLQG